MGALAPDLGREAYEGGRDLDVQIPHIKLQLLPNSPKSDQGAAPFASEQHTPWSPLGDKSAKIAQLDGRNLNNEVPAASEGVWPRTVDLCKGAIRTGVVKKRAALDNP